MKKIDESKKTKKMSPKEIHQKEIDRDNLSTYKYLKESNKKLADGSKVCYMYSVIIYYYYDENGDKIPCEDVVESYGRKDILERDFPEKYKKILEEHKSVAELRREQQYKVESNQPVVSDSRDSDIKNESNEEVVLNDLIEPTDNLQEKLKFKDIENYFRRKEPNIASLNISTPLVERILTDHFGIDEVIKKECSRLKYDIKKIISQMVTIKIVNPESVYASYDSNENYFGNYFKDIDLKQMYRSLPKIGSIKDKIMLNANKHINDKLDRVVKILFVDGTNWYYTSHLTSNEKHRSEIVKYLMEDMKVNPSKYSSVLKAVLLIHNMWESNSDNSNLNQTIIDKFKNISTPEKKAAALYYFMTNEEECKKLLKPKDTLRLYGNSKENRISPLVHMFVALDSSGIPFEFTINSGNTVDYTAMENMIKDIREKYEFKEGIMYVGDSGTCSFDILKKLQENNEGYVIAESMPKNYESINSYVINAEYMSYPDENGISYPISKPRIMVERESEGGIITECFLDEFPNEKDRLLKQDDIIIGIDMSTAYKFISSDPNLNGKQCDSYLCLLKDKDKINSKTKEKIKVNRIVTFSRKRFDKEFNNIATDFNTSNLYVNGQLDAQPKTPKKVKFVNKFISVARDQATLNYKKYYCDLLLAGYKAFVINTPHNPDLSVTDALKLYYQEIDVEYTFKHVKSFFGLRPSFVTTDEAIVGHATICILAEMVIRYILAYIRKYYVAEEINFENILHAFRTANVTAIISAEKEVFYLKSGSDYNKTAKKSKVDLERVFNRVVYDNSTFDVINTIFGGHPIPTVSNPWEIGKMLVTSKNVVNQISSEHFKVAKMNRMKLKKTKIKHN